MAILTLDTSGIVELADRRATQHSACRATFERERGPHVIPTAILAEATFVLETRLSPLAVMRLIRDLRGRLLGLSWSIEDLDRVEALIVRYHDLPLGFADAAVVACAERHGGRILTLDRRHFDVVARGEGTITVLPP
jgi:predicted nucleic acid-binding protein